MLHQDGLCAKDGMKRLYQNREGLQGMRVCLMGDCGEACMEREGLSTWVGGGWWVFCWFCGGVGSLLVMQVYGAAAPLLTSVYNMSAHG